jgi:hypothetical protein
MIVCTVRINGEVRNMSAYDEPKEDCPYCGCETECDWVDVGVGSVQCGPYHCYNCHASEIGPEFSEWRTFEGDLETGFKAVWKEGHPFNENEMKFGWYDPNKERKISPYANTVNGHLVDHKTAKEMYRIGLLDDKGDLN